MDRYNSRDLIKLNTKITSFYNKDKIPNYSYIRIKQVGTNNISKMFQIPIDLLINIHMNKFISTLSIS